MSTGHLKIPISLSAFFATIGAIAAIASGVIGLTSSVDNAHFDRAELRKLQTQLKIRSADRSERISAELSLLKAQISELSKIPESVAVSSKIKAMDARIIEIDEKISVLNKTILTSPSRALELPLLQRDLISIQKQNEQSIESLKREISQAYDTIKWVIGTIILGILGLAASVFLREK